MSKIPSTFECQACGHSSTKWLGRCPNCGSWNSFLEEARAVAIAKGNVFAPPGGAKAVRLGEVSCADVPRILTSDAEFDRVLGGGLVPGSLVLLGGEPGVGKSTLLLQIARGLTENGRKVLYVSGEESAQQIKMRSERLQRSSDAPDAAVESDGDIYLLAESSLERILAVVDALGPNALIVDSIQTTISENLDSTPGSISQVRHVATQFLQLAKSRNLPVLLIGHVTKDGAIAGPKALEHIVDAVLYFEGERRHNHRIVRAVKNRFGAANEVGIFEMTSRGLVSVSNPSELFIRERGTASPGSAVTCALEGTRPILVEVEALVVATHTAASRRTSMGVDYNRISVLVAMLEKRLDIPMTGCDIYVNAAGGLEIDEPASDLAVFSAILSSFRNRPLVPHTVFMGELGLSGEVRPISHAHLRLREAAVMGFKACILPAGNLPIVDPVDGVELRPVKTVLQLSDLIFDV